MSVIQFKRPDPKPDPHLSGPAHCVGCQHEWVGVAPVGTFRLECPQCQTMKGVWRYPIEADDGDLAFTCNCGSIALTAYQRKGRFHIVCMGCGIHQTEALFG